MLFLTKFGNIDPFARSQSQIEDNSRAFIQFDNAEIKHYKGKTLTSKAHVDHLAVSRGSRTYELSGIRNGLIMSDKGPMKFSASLGHFNTANSNFVASKDVRVAMKDFDLKTSYAIIDQNRQLVTMPRPLSGRLYSGNGTAASMTLSLAAGHDIVVNSASWQGKTNLPQEGDSTAPKKWTMMNLSKIASSGDVVTYTDGQLTDGDVIVRGKTIEWNRKTDVVIATGKVSYWSGEADMTADKATIYRKEKRAIFETNVTMLIRPKDKREDKPVVVEIEPLNPLAPDQVSTKALRATSNSDKDLRDPKNLREYPMKVRADKIEYFYKKGDRHSHIEGNPQARQELPESKWRHVWSTTAFWDGQKDELTLFSTKDKIDVRMKNSWGDDLIAKVVTLSTKDDDDSYTAESISGEMVGSDSDEEDLTRKKDKSGGPPKGDGKTNGGPKPGTGSGKP